MMMPDGEFGDFLAAIIVFGGGAMIVTAVVKIIGKAREFLGRDGE
jgi:hypothetical protein